MDNQALILIEGQGPQWLLTTKKDDMKQGVLNTNQDRNVTQARSPKESLYTRMAT